MGLRQARRQGLAIREEHQADDEHADAGTQDVSGRGTRAKRGRRTEMAYPVTIHWTASGHVQFRSIDGRRRSPNAETSETMKRGDEDERELQWMRRGRARVGAGVLWRFRVEGAATAEPIRYVRIVGYLMIEPAMKQDIPGGTGRGGGCAGPGGGAQRGRPRSGDRPRHPDRDRGAAAERGLAAMSIEEVAARGRGGKNAR